MSDAGVRRGLGTAGAAVALYAIAATLDPAIAQVPSSDAQVTVVGVAAVVLGIRRLADRVRDPEDPEVAIPAVESRTAAWVPGDDFDDALEALDPSVRARVERAAVDAIKRRDGVTAEESCERIEAGDWTDDRTAAAFFSSRVGADHSTGAELRAAFAGRPPDDPVKQAVRAVSAVADLVRPTRDRQVPQLPDSEALRERLRFVPEAINPTTGFEANSPSIAAAFRADGGHADAGVESVLPLPPVGDGIDRSTGRLRGLGAVSLMTAGVGAILRTPGPFVVAAVFAAVAAVAAADRVGPAPPVAVSIERELSDPEPAPGETVRVTTTVRNDGRTIHDLRFVDGIPGALEVTDGSPRLDARLASGETATCTYEVTAETGVHPFEPAVAIACSRFGERQRLCRVPTEGTITCAIHPDPRAVDPQEATQRQPGRVSTDSGGEGVEFYGTREYRHGDPTAVIDWHRYASTGELSTIEFREEQSTAVLIVVDARREAYLAGEAGGRPAVRVAAEGAAKLADGLLDAGNLVGVTALSPSEEPLWLSPSAGRGHRTRIREALTSHPAVSSTPPDGVFLSSAAVTRLRSRVRGRVEVLLVSPLADDEVRGIVESLVASDHPVTVISPAVTVTDSPGRLLADIKRQLRCSQLRSVGVAVHDWDLDDGLALSLERAARRGQP